MNTTRIYEHNTLRISEAAARQVERAGPALEALQRIPGDTSPVHARYRDALRLRLAYPDASLAELADKMGMTKNRYWRILARALDCADRIAALAAEQQQRPVDVADLSADEISQLWKARKR